MAPPPPQLPMEIVEDILVRFPPDQPAHIVRAALVCKHWCGLIAGHGFRRRYRQRHRVAPVLGLVANLASTGGAARFVPTSCAFRPARADRHGYRVHDARHGRVLLNRIPAAPQQDNKAAEEDSSALAVWDPTTGDQHPLPLLLRPQQVRSWNTAVLCAAAASSCDCDHLDCHFRVVFVGIDATEMFTHVYSSETAAWSEMATTAAIPGGDEQLDVTLPGVLARGGLYFLLHKGTRMLRCDPATREMSVDLLPDLHTHAPRIALMAMEEDGGGGVGFAQVDLNCILRIWYRKIAPERVEDRGFWVITRAVDLKTMQQQLGICTQLPADDGFGFVFSPCVVVAFADGAGVVFLKTEDGLYSFDIKSDHQYTKALCWRHGFIFTGGFD